MKFVFYFRHMLPSSNVQQYAEDKLSDCFGKYDLGFGEVQLTFVVEHQAAEVSCSFAAAGQPLHLVERRPNMYAAIDGLVDRVDECLRRMKDKMRSHRVRSEMESEEPLEMVAESW